ncbi:MAG TPA: 3-phosphoshikimate 1-carboxyvinyltransferase [Pyrinomonadaceae bacterium]
MIIRPAKRLVGEINLPGDKSISHRAAIFAALAEGTTRIENFSTADDCAATLDCLEKLAVKIDRNKTEIIVHGVGKNGFSAPEEPLDCRNSGTTMRLLAGVLAGQNFVSVLTGDESLQKRPMRRVIAPLELMGAKIESNDGRAPLTIHGKNPLKAISFEPPVASAQIKSCVLLAGLNADGETKILEKTPTRDHTERMLAWLNVEVKNENNELAVFGDAKLSARDLSVPADVSSSAFFLVAAACLKNSDLLLKNVGLNSSRTAVIEVLQKFGAKPEILNRSEAANEPRGDLRVLGGELNSQQENGLRGEIIANLIDELPILSVLGTQLENGLEIRDAAELRVKESDRIRAVVENLRRMNARVEEFEDGLRVEKSNLKGARIDSFGDHRIAMSFAVAGLLAAGETEIENAEAVAVSFPDFFDLLESAAER